MNLGEVICRLASFASVSKILLISVIYNTGNKIFSILLEKSFSNEIGKREKYDFYKLKSLFFGYIHEYSIYIVPKPSVKLYVIIDVRPIGFLVLAKICVDN